MANDPNSPPQPRRRSSRFRRADSLYLGVLVSASLTLFVVILGIIWVIYSQSRLSITTFGPKFVTGNDWDPNRNHFGLMPFLLGTLYTSFWALLIAVPISIGTAVFLSEAAPWRLRVTLGFLVEMLAAIPSVVYGLWGVFVLIPWLVEHVETPISDSAPLGKFFLFNAPPNGNDFLAASLVLAIMVIPIITGIAREIIDAVSLSLREGSYALGATKWETIWRVVLPSAKAGLTGAVVLGLGRALGETIAVTMLIGNNPAFKLALFSPGYTMSSLIANEFTEAPTPLYRSALMEVGLALLISAMIVNGCARLLVNLTGREAHAQ